MSLYEQAMQDVAALRDATGGQWEILHQEQARSVQAVVRFPDGAMDGYAAIIGALDYDADGFITYVYVAEPYQRRGIATAVADYLRDQVGLVPSFAPAGCGNSAAGDAWVAAYQTAGRLNT